MQNHTEPAWPEKVAGFLAAIEILFLLFIGVVGNKNAGSADWFEAATYLWRFPVFTIGPLWALMRLVDFVAGGPAKRSRMLIVLPPQSMQGSQTWQPRG